MEYNSAMRKREILPFATRMDLESIMLNEISLAEKDKYCMFSLILGILKSQTHRSREYNGDCQGVGELGRCWSKGPNFHYKIDKVSVPNVQQRQYNSQHCIIKLKVVKIVDFKCYHHTQKR